MRRLTVTEASSLATTLAACAALVALAASCRGRSDAAAIDGGVTSLASGATTTASAAPVSSPSASSTAEPAPSASATAYAIGSAAPPPPPLVAGEPKPTFRKATVDAAKLAKIFAAMPELSRIGGDVRLFDPNDGSYLLRSDAPHPGITFTTQPLLYSPEPGLEILVATGAGKGLSFVVALYVTGDDEYRLGSYFLMLHDTAPVALAYDANAKDKRLIWTACWQCPGEEGFVSVRAERRVVIVQK